MKTDIQTLLAGTAQVISPAELEKKLASGKKLTIKFGADPTAPNLHLGHAVVLQKLRQFQDLGHTVVFLIGDFTARIGDPTGRSKTRPPLSEEQIATNSKTYFEQVGRVLDPQKIVIRYNSEWLGTLSSADWIKLCAKVTLARLIEREDFAQRMEAHQPIGFHELLYPILQGYDSVALKADVELGGTDQTFNLIMGRFLQEQEGQEPQAVMTMPLLEGLDGVAKMSKSYGNDIGLAEPAADAYGKLMSMSDTLMWRYYEVLLQMPVAEIAQLKADVAASKAHPMDLKKLLAFKIIARFWSEQEAHDAQQNFEQLFQKKDLSQAQEFVLAPTVPETLSIIELVKLLDPSLSNSEIRRLILANAISLDEQKCIDPKAIIALTVGLVVRVGKHRFYKLVR
jgi:tyrosyl-tRNA synthetase